MVNDVERFVAIYNDVTKEQTKALGMKPRNPTSRLTIREVEDYLAWASKNSVDPALFMRARHDAASGARIAIKHLSSIGENFISNYRQWGEWLQSMRATNERFKAVPDFNGTETALTPLHRAGKLALADDRLVCMLSPEISGGWHPQSSDCQGCKEAEPCKKRLSRTTRRIREWRNK